MDAVCPKCSTRWVESPLDLSQVELRKADNSGPDDLHREIMDKFEAANTGPFIARPQEIYALQNQEEAVRPNRGAFWADVGGTIHARIPLRFTAYSTDAVTSGRERLGE